VFGTLDVEKLAASPFQGDDSEANGSSIAVLAEYGDRRLLLAADAHSDVLLAGIERLLPPGGRLQVHAFKLPHHGSRANLSRELLERVECRRYLFSTDGTRHCHPDREAVARVIKFGGPQPELIFNYRTQYNEIWEDGYLQPKYGYAVTFPKHGPGFTVDV